MAWSTTAPTLPSGSEGTQVGTTSWENNNLKITSVVYVARLNGKEFAVQVAETRQQYRYNYTDLYLRCDIGGVTGTPETGIKGTSSSGSTTAYFTGEADAGENVDVIVGFQESVSSSLKTVSFTAPDLLGVPLWYNDNGTTRKVAKLLYNDNGTTRNVILKYHQ